MPGRCSRPLDSGNSATMDDVLGAVNGGARLEARKATSSATSSGRPMGIPPSESIKPCRAVWRSVPALAASRSTNSWAAVVSMKPGGDGVHANAFGSNFLGENFAVTGQPWSLRRRG
jgi:hypothetical protein